MSSEHYNLGTEKVTWLCSSSTAGQVQNFPALFEFGWGGKKKKQVKLIKKYISCQEFKESFHFFKSK